MNKFKYILGITILSLSFFFASGQNVKTVLGVDNAAGGPPSYTLLYDTKTAISYSGDPLASTNANMYHGTRFTAAGDTLSKVVFVVSKNAGDVSGKTYKARLWTLSGDDLDTAVAVSGAVAGDNGWSSSLMECIFVTPFTTSNGTDYVINLTCEEGADAANYIGIEQWNNTQPSPPPSPVMVTHNNMKVLQSSFGGFMTEMEIYESP
jgi:hypothetical protein